MALMHVQFRISPEAYGELEMARVLAGDQTRSEALRAAVHLYTAYAEAIPYRQKRIRQLLGFEAEEPSPQPTYDPMDPQGAKAELQRRRTAEGADW